MLWRNWARTEWSRPPHVVEPKTTEEVAKAVTAAAKAKRRIKAVGSGHSFNGIAAPTQVLLSLAALRGVIEVDKERRQAKVHAGTTLRELSKALHIWNLAMPNLGDIDHQTIAGAIATGTHGTGLNHQGLAAQVTGNRDDHSGRLHASAAPPRKTQRCGARSESASALSASSPP